MKKSISDILKEETQSVDISMSEKLIHSPIIKKQDFNKNENLSQINDFGEEKRKNDTKKFKIRFSFRVLALNLCLVAALLISVFSIFISKNKASELTTYIININPSICITTDKSDKVVSAYSLNDDGDKLISDEKFKNVKGQSFDECIKQIVCYLVDKNYICLSSEFGSESGTEQKQSKKLVNFEVTNNKEKFAMEKSKHAREIFNSNLEERGFYNYEIDEKFLPVSEFRDKMGFDKKLDDLDEMKEEILSHSKYFNPNFVPIED